MTDAIRSVLTNGWKAILAAVLPVAAMVVVDLANVISENTGEAWIVTVVVAVLQGLGVYRVPPGSGLVTPTPAD